MDIMRMSPDKIAEVSNRCIRLADEYDKNLNETHEIMEMLNSGWNGSGMEQIERQLQQSLLEVKKVQTLLLQMSDCLTRVEETMRQVDQQITSQLRNITI